MRKWKRYHDDTHQNALAAPAVRGVFITRTA